MATPYNPRRSAVDMAGEQRGTWRVVSRAPNVGTLACWNVECTECGFTRAIKGNDLRRSRLPKCSECSGRAQRKSAVNVVEFRHKFSMPVGFEARCSACRSMARFVAGKCGVCGCLGTADRLEHVDARFG